MALSKKTLQKKREKKKKKHKIKMDHSLSSTLAYSTWPIYECMVPTELWERGIGQIIVARKNNQGDMAVGIYLVDTFCLGIKNCFLRFVSCYEYQNMLEQIIELCGEMQVVESSYACTLIYKAVNYAKELGFEPHQDFTKVSKLLHNIPINETLNFVFGKEDKPCYIQGPNESYVDIKRILRKLEMTVGKNNYHFIIEAQYQHLSSEFVSKIDH